MTIPTDMSELTLRPLCADDLPATWAMSQALKWPHRPEDWQEYLHWAQRDGNPVAVCHEGSLIGCALVWHWGPDQASIGMVIIDPAWQKRGIGRHLFQTLMESLAGRDVLLHATAAGQPLYTRLGFETDGINRQYQGCWHATSRECDATTSTTTTATAAATAKTQTNGSASAKANANAEADTGTGTEAASPAHPVRPLHAADIPAVLALDEQQRGLKRADLMQSLLEAALAPQPGLPDCRAAIITDPDAADTIMGYGLLRRFGRGWVLGPLLAPNAARMIALIECLTHDMAGQFIRIDLPEHVHAFAARTSALSPEAEIVSAAKRMRKPIDRSAATGTQGPGAKLSATIPPTPGKDAPQTAVQAQDELLRPWLQARGLALVDESLVMRRLARRPDAQAIASVSPTPLYALLTQALG